MQEERSNSTRVIRAACLVARLCIDKDKICKGFGTDKNESFIHLCLRKIGQCLTITDHRAQVALDYYINPIET